MRAAPTHEAEPHTSKYARKVAARSERDRYPLYVPKVHPRGMLARPPYYIEPGTQSGDSYA